MATVLVGNSWVALSDVYARALRGEEVVLGRGGNEPRFKLVQVGAEMPTDTRQAGALAPDPERWIDPLGKQPFRREFGTLGPISNEAADEAARPLPEEWWGWPGDDD